MARDGMGWLITKLREFTHAGTADHTVAGVQYWTDDQLEEKLDATRKTHKDVVLTALSDFSGGDYTYTEYPFTAHQWAEGTATGWNLVDGDGSAVPSYTVNFHASMITFDADTAGTSYLLSTRTYDMYGVAAEVWEQKAGFYEHNVDWSADNHSIKASQQRDFCLKKAEEYRRMSGQSTGFARFVRVDEWHE